MRRRRNPGVADDVQNVVTIGAVVVVGYLIYQAFTKLPKLPKAVGGAIGDLAATIWAKLHAANQMPVEGDVVLPDGTDVGPLASMQVRQDAVGNVYTLIGGDVYQIGPHDDNGNWPVTLVLDPNFGVTGGDW